MCQAYATSYGTDVVMTRGCNTIGPRQYPEKLVPLFVTNALQDLPLPVYGDGRQVRNWLHAEDHAAAIDLVLRRGQRRAGLQRRRRQRAREPRRRARHPRARRQATVAHSPRRGPSRARPPLRPRHDAHHEMSSAGDHAGTGAQTLHDTVDWYVANSDWWLPIRQRDPRFQEFYDRQYGAPAGGSGDLSNHR